MKKVTPFLWYNNNAEEAVNHYTSIFKNSKILDIARYPEGSPGQAGAVMTVNFQIEDQEFTALNGGPEFPFSEAFSIAVNCETQQEVDYLWEKLLEGGEESQCGWLKDKFGLSWQIVPVILSQMMTDTDPKKSGRVMKALLQMKKLDIAALKQAYDNV